MAEASFLGYYSGCLEGDGGDIESFAIQGRWKGMNTRFLKEGYRSFLFLKSLIFIEGSFFFRSAMTLQAAMMSRSLHDICFLFNIQLDKVLNHSHIAAQSSGPDFPLTEYFS